MAAWSARTRAAPGATRVVGGQRGQDQALLDVEMNASLVRGEPPEVREPVNERVALGAAQAQRGVQGALVVMRSRGQFPRSASSGAVVVHEPGNGRERTRGATR